MFFHQCNIIFRKTFEEFPSAILLVAKKRIDKKYLYNKDGSIINQMNIMLGCRVIDLRKLIIIHGLHVSLSRRKKLYKVEVALIIVTSSVIYNSEIGCMQ